MVRFHHAPPFMKLQEPLLTEYLRAPLAQDEAVREACHLPWNRYYTVAVWPVPGEVVVDRNRVREVRAKKVSKSDQCST